MNLTTLPRHTASDRLAPAFHRGLARLVGAFTTTPIDRDAARVSHEIDAIRTHAS